MKKTLLLLIFIGTLISCQDYQRDKQQQAIDHRIEKELARGERNDTIFLGLRFGMTENEILRHFKKLTRENKLSLNESNTYEYEFDFGENSMPSKGKATFSTDYFNNKLFKLSISVKSEDLVSNAQLIQLSLVKIYASKYGYSYLERKSLSGNTSYYIWIDGNRMIEIVAGINDARIFYTDLIVEQAKEKFDDKETIEKTKAIKDDI